MRVEENQGEYTKHFAVIIEASTENHFDSTRLSKRHIWENIARILGESTVKRVILGVK